MQRYEPKAIEAKWQKIWADTKLYEVSEDISKDKVYATPMLPYPSGAGLHVGHVRNYSIADTIARFHRQQGFNVLSAMGWDSFGLPAENYAIKTGNPPWETTQTNIKNFKSQLMRLGMSYDWSREIDTSDPDYYKWTQWVFIQLFNAGLAYQAESWQWWCPECKTVLANEQVVNGCCWRHEDTPVEKKQTKQWFFKITDYADELLDETDNLNWPKNIKLMQTNWIGRSEGTEIEFRIDNGSIKVFTTRPDTIYGATYLVLAPEHEYVDKVTTAVQKQLILDYISTSSKQTNVQRMDENRPKTGVFTGAYAKNPATKENIPIWVADYVLPDYGTGAIMAVPAHDERDWNFAKQFDLPIVWVYDQEMGSEDSWYTGEGILKNSGEYDGLTTEKARSQIIADLSETSSAKKTVNYKIRDWLISRQRYWGAPIPIIHCEKCGAVAVPEEELPVVLPKIDNFTPTGKTVSVLAGVDEWVNVKCPNCKGPAKRETDTMDGYACSSWYMYRYTDPHNEKNAFSKENVGYWLPVDFYFGGDHAVSHLLYFRFWHKFFVDQGLIDKTTGREPVKRLVYNGYINAADGRKMSKSLGNVIDPLEIIDSGYGADALRMYELFIGPYDQDVDWNSGGVPGTYRFIQRVWNLVQEYITESELGPAVASDNQSEQEAELVSALHRTIKKVTEDLNRFSFNTSIAALMELVNTMNRLKEQLPLNVGSNVWRETLSNLLSLLAPFAPHVSEELWQQLGNDESVHISAWPGWDEALVVSEMMTIVVQVNGKVRANLALAVGTPMDEATSIAQKEPSVSKHLEGKEIKKTIAVENKLINFVV